MTHSILTTDIRHALSLSCQNARILAVRRLLTRAYQDGVEAENKAYRELGAYDIRLQELRKNASQLK